MNWYLAIFHKRRVTEYWRNYTRFAIIKTLLLVEFVAGFGIGFDDLRVH